MKDPITILRERAQKAEAKVLRYSKSLESAKKELDDLNTALRVMADISGESDAPEVATTTTSTYNRQQEIADLLGEGRAQGRSPVDLFEAYKAQGSDEINIDTFRTTIWRMKGKAYTCEGADYIIQSGDGEYWKDRIGTIDDFLG